VFRNFQKLLLDKLELMKFDKYEEKYFF